MEARHSVEGWRPSSSISRGCHCMSCTPVTPASLVLEFKCSMWRLKARALQGGVKSHCLRRQRHCKAVGCLHLFNSIWFSTILPPQLSTASSTTSERSLTDLQKPSMAKRLLGSAPLVACTLAAPSAQEVASQSNALFRLSRRRRVYEEPLTCQSHSLARLQQGFEHWDFCLHGPQACVTQLLRSGVGSGSSPQW